MTTTVLRRGLPLALVASLAVPGAAQGAVRLGERDVVVSSAAGSVHVQRAPFGLRFASPSGRTLLDSVGAGPPRARPLPLTRDPEPLGLEREPDRAVYAPLTFETGRELIAQWNGSFFPGNLLFARRSGTVHMTGDVLRARRAGTGAVVTVATSAPGRRLVVRIRPAPGGLRVTTRVTGGPGVMAMSSGFRTAPGEAFHGFGGRHDGLDRRGRKATGWVNQENVGGATLNATAVLPAVVEDGTDYTIASLGLPPIQDEPLPGGPGRYLVPNGPDAAYYVQNQFVSSRGYGFVLHNAELTRWRMGNDRRDAWQVHASAAGLDFTVAPAGTVAGAVGGATTQTGRHRLPPAWAQGAVLWRAIQVAQPAETRASVQAKIDADLAEIRRRGAPVRGYAFEGWNLLGPAGTRAVIRRLHAMGIKAILYVRAHVAYDELNTQPRGDVEEVREQGLAVRDARGRPAVYGMTGVDALTLDVTNPRTRAWWKRRLELLVGWGADGFMQDFGEHVQVTDRFHDGSTGATMHNRYPVLYHELTRSLEDGLERRFGRELFWFTRSGFTGSAASEMGNFPGDETAEWTGGSGIASLAPDMLNRAVGGAFGYSTDIGGYLDRFNPPPDEELWTRWHEWAALSPYFRLHNSQTTGTRMPWAFGDAGYARWERLARLHERAVPLIRRLWAQGRRTGIPPTRPMWLAMPGDRRARGADQQWMLGEDVLVAPVVTQGATSRDVLFPTGCWRHGSRGGSPVRGPGVRRVAAPLGEPAWFVRCGTRLPAG